MYIYEKAVSEVQVPKAKASLILSVLGVCNTVGRLAAGLLADRPWTDAVVIHNVAAIAAGLSTCLVAVFFTFELLCLYAAMFGIFLGKQGRAQNCSLAEGQDRGALVAVR